MAAGKRKSLKVKGSIKSGLSKAAKKTFPKKIKVSTRDQQPLNQLSNITTCLWEWNILKNQIWLSDNAHKIFGTSKKKFRGSYESLMKLLKDDHRELVSAEIKKCLQSDKEYFVQYRISKAHEIPRWIEAIGKVHRDRKGNPERMIGSFYDITNIKLGEIERKEWEARYKVIVTASNLIIYDYDLLTGNIEWEGALQEVLGYKKDELGNFKSWTNLIHRNDRKKALNQLEIARQGLKLYDIHYRFKSKSKSYVDIHDKGIFLLDETGQPYRMLGTMQDISEKVRIEKDLLESNKFKESMENAMPGMLYVYNLIEQENIYVNHNITTTLGWTWEEIEAMGKNLIFQLVHPDDVENLTQWSNERSRTVKDAEYRLRTKSGEWRWFHSRDTVFQKDEKGNVTQIIGVAQDITERKKIEEALKESEQRFRTLQEASFGGIGLHDKGIIIDCNKGLSVISGYSQEELIGKDGVRLLIAPEYRETVLQNILSGYEKPYDVEGIHKDGTRYALEISGKVVPYKGRNIRVTELRDITERKLIEQKILEQNARLQSITADLQRKNEQLEEFTQIVSHNLRSPMGNITSLLTFMENSSSEEDKAQFIKFLKESAANAMTTLDELNEVLKVKQNKNIEKQTLEFDKVFGQVKTMISAKIAETSAEIHSDFSRAPSIRYPHIYLESIFLNLLTNALKYSKPNQKPVIHVKTYYDKNDIILEIKDNGLGINMDRHGHQVFKLQKTFHKHPESRGIGLFMIKNQIETMGGEITIKSQENVGTTLTINFNKHQMEEE
ncbi:PAS domain-containing protein [Chryseolinea sp. H1M3-3]|uniref:PAS domain-containing protein n=1 Tax=Chryseolinea sp. H1M3-3 TaxID=3034144 RepID=UPI0023EB8B1D|nr:PAS domain-containing protein [Chryseolinea sp. H1M3-3]